MTSIGNQAFAGTSLTSITIPSSVTSIGSQAFSINPRLTSIIFEGDAPTFGTEVFKQSYSVTVYYDDLYSGWSSTVAGRTALQTNTLTFALNGDSTEYSLTDCDTSASGALVITSTYKGLPVTSIGESAFEGCSGLISITIPDSVTSIERGVFSGCSNLTSITIPDGVTSVGDYLFYNCSGLTNITIPSSVTSIGGSAFYNCSSLTSVTIPDSVTSIGGNAFSNCSSLTSVTIPDSVTSIGNEAFYECTSLTSITLPYKFAGSAGSFGIPGDAEITVNFNDVSEGLLANTNFVAGISQEVTFDSSAVDQAIADEAQARADADAILQANIDAVAVSMQSYVDSAVAQARADGVTAGIQSVTSDPQSYQLYNESSIMEMNVTNPTLSMLNESEQAQVEFTLETSTDLEDWNIEERIQRTVQATGDKFFVRIKSGIPYVTPTVLVFNHPSYGEILTDQSGNVLYGFSIDSVGGDPIYIGSAWPLAPQITDPEPDAGVTAALTSGTFSNASGGPWLKVNNRPVYTYASDSEPNQASGHGLGSVWFTIKPDGTLNQ